MNLKKAYTYLGDVQEHKQIIPFRRYAGGIGRASQAKQFKTTKGAWAPRRDAPNTRKGMLTRFARRSMA